MKEFFDTSVLIAAMRESHMHHEASFKRFTAAQKNSSACAVHSLAEFYATMTVLPPKPVYAPEQVLFVIEEIRQRLTVIALDESDYAAALEQVAERGITSGKIYDALLLRCAAKAKAETIYTWNLKHFQSIAPELADRMRTP